MCLWLLFQTPTGTCVTGSTRPVPSLSAEQAKPWMEFASVTFITLDKHTPLECITDGKTITTTATKHKDKQRKEMNRD